MKKKITFILSIAALMGVLTTGCGKSTETSDTSVETTVQEVASEDVAETSEEPATQVTGDLKELNIGFPSAGSDWPGGALGLANAQGILDEYLNPLGYTAKLQGFTGAAPAIHEALVAGDLDFAYYAGMASILAKSNGIDTKLLAIEAYSPMWELFASTSSGITDIKDLKGAKIAYIRGTAAHEYLIKVLTEAGLTAEDVELINMTIPEGIAALVGGSIDAVVITIGQEADPKVSEVGVVIHNEREAGKENYYSPGVITGRTEFIEANKEATVALLEALLDAKDAIVADPNTYYELYADKSGYSLDYVLSAIADDDVGSTLPYNLDDIYLNKLTTIKTFLLDNELIAKDFEFSSWIDSSYLESAQQLYKSEK